MFAERARLIERRGGALLDVLRAVGAADAGFEDEFVAFDARPGAEGNLAAAFERGEQRAFGDDGAARFGVVELFERGGSLGVVGAAFDADGALADGGQENFGREDFGDAMRQAEAIESGFGEHDGVVFTAFDFAEARVHVAAEVANVEIGAKMKELRATAETAGADASAFAKSGKIGAVVGDEAVADVFAAQNRGKRKAGRRFCRNVFDAVNGDVDGIVEQSFFELFDEDSLPADFGERSLREFVATRFDDDDFAFDAGGLEDLAADELGLPLGEEAAARADAERSSLLPIGEEEVAQGFDVLDFAAEFAFVAEALGRLDEKFLERFFHDRFNVFAIARREMGHLRETRMEEGGAVFTKAGSESGDEADEFDAGLPGEKFGDVIFDDGFGARDFTFAGLAILRNDGAEVVEIVEIGVVEVGGRGFDVARHAEIHQEECAIAAGFHCGFEDEAREDGIFGRDGGDDDVGLEQRVLPVGPFDDGALEFSGEFDGAVARAIHDEDVGDASIAQRGDDSFRDGACANDEGGVSGELAEDALGEFYSCGSDRHWTHAELRFGANALADFERSLKKAIENGAGRALFMRGFVGVAHLAEDFGFAKEHGIESGRDAEEMADGVAVVMVIERADENFAADGMEFAEEMLRVP